MLVALNAAVEELAGVAVSDLPDAAIRAEYLAVRRVIDRLEHRAAALLVAVDGRGIPDGDGAVSTPAWVQWQTGQRYGDAARSLEAGQACEHLTLVDKAWAQGEISASAAGAIAAGRVDAHAEVFASLESTLVDYAAGHDWRDLHGVIRYYRHCVAALDEREPADRNGFHHSKTLERWVTNGDFDDLAGQILADAIAAAMGPPVEGDDRTPAKRRADAVIDLVRYFLDHQDLPDEGGEAPHVNIVVSWDTIMAGVPCPLIPAALGPSLSDAQLHQMLCDANISTTILGRNGQPLHVSTETRRPPRWMRRELARRDRGCRYPGCDRKPNRCEAHHVWAWEDGGPTALHNLILLCSRHHHVVHRKGWRNTFDGLTFTIYRPDGTTLGST